MNILLTNLGSDVQFLRTFLASMQNLGISGKVIVSNESIAPSSYASDSIEITGDVLSPDYLSRLLSLCQKHSIGILIPRSDQELCLLARHAAAFLKIGCVVLTSDEPINSTCATRSNALSFLSGSGARTPVVVKKNYSGSDIRFPCLVRSSDRQIGDQIVLNSRELEYETERLSDPIVFEYCEKSEQYEIDCLMGFRDSIISIVPRLQTPTRHGISQRTVKNQALIMMAKEILKSLPGAFGNITLECFVADGNVCFTDIIPRFTSGSSLTYQANSDFPFHVFELVAGFIHSGIKDDWIEGVTTFDYSNPIYFFPQNNLYSVNQSIQLNIHDHPASQEKHTYHRDRCVNRSARC